MSGGCRVLGKVRDPAVKIPHAHDLLFAIDADELGAHIAQIDSGATRVRTSICVNIRIFSVYGT